MLWIDRASSLPFACRCRRARNWWGCSHWSTRRRTRFQANASLRMEDVHQRILIQTMQALQVETVALGMIEGEQLIFQAAAGQNAGNILGRTIPLGRSEEHTLNSSHQA